MFKDQIEKIKKDGEYTIATVMNLRWEYDRLQEIVEMAWKGYGYDQEWDCDCPVCAAIRTRTPYGK